jgi:uncharacterized protein YukE
MWNTSKPPSVRDLAARIASHQTETAAELARIREEQRALQRALEAEQATRLDAVAALHDRWTAHTQEAQLRISAALDANDQNYDAIDHLRAAVDSLTARLDATLADVADLRARLAEIEGQEELPPAGPGDGPLLQNRLHLYADDPPAVGAVSPDDADTDAAGVQPSPAAVLTNGADAHG